MDLPELSNLPSSPQAVITPWRESPGQDLLGLRSPAERIATTLMNGVSSQSALVRYLGVRSWIIYRYTSLSGPDNSAAFRAFAGKCEAALVLGHKLAAIPTLSMIGSKGAALAIANGRDALFAESLANNLALDIYAGPSQDLGISTSRSKVPGLSKERGLPLATEIGKILDSQPALQVLDTANERQPLNPGHAEDLARAFPMASPVGTEREMLIEAICPPRPRPAERSRLSAYCLLLSLTANSGGPLLGDGDAVFSSVIEGGGANCPEVLSEVVDGWLRFLVRDSLVAVHERAVSVVLGEIGESPNQMASVDTLMHRIERLEPGPILNALGLTSFTSDTPIGKLHEAVSAACASSKRRGGLNRWTGSINELSLIVAAKHREPEVLALLPVAWMLAVQRTEPGLSDRALSIDDWSGASAARLGLGAVIAPMVRLWRGSNEPLGKVIAKLTRRSVDQHLRIAWSRMQADPSRNVALLVSDGTTWSADGSLDADRASSRLYRAINWLRQLGLTNESGITVDGAAVLQRGLRTLSGAES